MKATCPPQPCAEEDDAHLRFALGALERIHFIDSLYLSSEALCEGGCPPYPGTPYFSKAAEVVDIAGRLKKFPICVAALKCSDGFGKVGCTRD
jgi:hypothetical protein